MVTKELISYITAELQRGTSIEQFAPTLISQGWKQQDILNALKQIDNKKSQGEVDLKRLYKKFGSEIIFILSSHKKIVIAFIFIIIPGIFFIAQWLLTPKPISKTTPNINTADWKTFESKEISFSLKAPPTWRFAVSKAVKRMDGTNYELALQIIPEGVNVSDAIIKENGGRSPVSVIDVSQPLVGAALIPLQERPYYLKKGVDGLIEQTFTQVSSSENGVLTQIYNSKTCNCYEYKAFVATPTSSNVIYFTTTFPIGDTAFLSVLQGIGKSITFQNWPIIHYSEPSTRN
jgi:hypothetical protein